MSKILSVSKVNELVEKLILNSDIKNIEIEGEMSNVTYQSKGHLYFNLKEKDENLDEHSIKCILFGYKYKNIPLDLKEGDKVKIVASISYYKQNGTISFLCSKLEKIVDLGDILKKLEQLKKEYFEKGYFSKEKKKKKPLLVKRIGVVTSPTGDAIEDIKNTAFSRDENIQIFLYPANVQGKDAKYEIKEGIEYFNANNDKYNLDALIIGRGGGSIEDLWAFNEKEVIEAIFNSKIYTVSSVGHERDELLSDLVADMRASTPTQAAMYLVSEKEVILEEMLNYKKIINQNTLHKIQILKKDIENFKSSYVYKNFFNLIFNKIENFNNLCLNYEKMIQNILISKKEKINLKDLKEKYIFLVNQNLKDLKNSLENTKLKLEKHSHEDILKKGYSITRIEGKIIKDISSVKKGDKLETILSNGKIVSVVR